MQTRSTARSSAAPRPEASSRTSAPSSAAPSEQRVGHRRRLLVDLLGHEVVEAPLPGGGHVPVDGQGRRPCRGTVQRHHPQGTRPELGELVVLEGEQLPGRAQQGRDVRGQERRAVTDPDDEWGDPPGCHHQVGLVGVDRRHGKGAADLPQCTTQAVRQTRAVRHLRFDQMAEDLRVGLGDQDVAGRHQAVGQLDVVLDDAVVDDGQASRAVEMGVGVLGGRLTMGRPTGVTHPTAGSGRRVLGQAAEVAHRVGALGRTAPPQPVVPRQHHPGRVVAAVLQAPQPLEDRQEDVVCTGDADDSTHRSQLPDCHRSDTAAEMEVVGTHWRCSRSSETLGLLPGDGGGAPGTAVRLEDIPLEPGGGGQELHHRAAGHGHTPADVEDRGEVHGPGGTEGGGGHVLGGQEVTVGGQGAERDERLVGHQRPLDLPHRGSGQ